MIFESVFLPLERTNLSLLKANRTLARENIFQNFFSKITVLIKKVLGQNFCITLYVALLSRKEEAL